MALHPAPPTPKLTPQTEAISGVDRLFWMGEERAWEPKGLGPEKRVNFTRRDSVQ